MSFENLMQVSSLFSTQDVICCVRDTEASSAFQNFDFWAY